MQNGGPLDTLANHLLEVLRRNKHIHKWPRLHPGHLSRLASWSCSPSQTSTGTTGGRPKSAGDSTNRTARTAYLSTGDGFIFGRVRPARARREHAALLIEVEAEEEGHRVPINGSVVVDPVHGRREAVVGQPRQEVANVDDKSVRDWGHLDPLALLGEDLQAPDRVLPEEGKGLQVRVRSQADVDGGIGRVLVLGVWWQSDSQKEETEPSEQGEGQRRRRSRSLQ